MGVNTVARAMKVLRGGSVVLVGEEAEKQKGDAALQKFAERAARLNSLVLRVALDLVTGLVEGIRLQAVDIVMNLGSLKILGENLEKFLS